MSHRPFKQRLYPELARIPQALASDRRLEIIDLLAQAPRNVEALAAATEMSIANVSQHLQTLRNARLVEAERQGNKVVYRLTDPAVVELWLALRSVAERRLPDVARVGREFAVEGAEGQPFSRDELQKRLSVGDLVVIDVRPAMEFQHGHLPGAISIPPEELAVRIDELPRDRPIVAYCRGPYCLFADEAVALLRQRGFVAHRLDGGWPEWSVEGRPVEVASAEGPPGSPSGL